MEELLKLIGSFSFGGVTVFVIITHFARNPEKVEKWQALIYEWLSKISTRYEYLAIKHDLQSKINSFANTLSKDLGTPNTKVKLRWAAKSENETVEIEDDGVVIVLRDQGYKNKNFVHAAYFFTSTTLLASTKRHLSEKQSKSLDLFTTKKVIERSSASALNLFMRDYFQPLMEDTRIRYFIKKFLLIDKSGLYTHVLLQELSYLGAKTFLEKRDKAVIEEVNLLIEFLAKRAAREVGDTTTQEEFVGKYSRHSIKIVSTKQVRDEDRYQIPAKRILKAFDSGIENVYILGPHENGGKSFIHKACDFIKEHNKDVEIQRKTKFKNTTKKNGNEMSVLTYFVHLCNPAKAQYIIEDGMIEQLESFSASSDDEE